MATVPLLPFLKKAMVLPFLPRAKIAQAVDSLQDSVPVHLDNEGVKSFFQYLKNYWVEKVGVSALSVCGRGMRTNNGVESFHAIMLQKLKKVHPGLWEFLSK